MLRHKQEIIQPRMTNDSSDPFAISDNEFADLLWENGQIVIQSQSSRAPKSSFPSTAFCYGTVQAKPTREIDPKFSQSRSDGHDYCTTKHSANRGVNTQEDDTVPWISFPVEEVLTSETLQPQNDYCAEFLNEFLAFDMDPLSAPKCSIAATGQTDKFSQEVRRSNNTDRSHATKAPRWNWASGRMKATHPQQNHASALNSKSTVVDSCGSGIDVAQKLHCRDVMDRRLQNQGLKSSKQLQQPTISGLMNFSHFARPAALAKVTHQSAVGWKRIDKASPPPNSNPVRLTPIESVSSTKDANKVSGQSGSDPHKLVLDSAMEDLQGGGSVELSNKIRAEDALRKTIQNCTKMPDNLPSSNVSTSMVLCGHDIEAPEAALPYMCSVKITGTASNEPKHGEKRKECDEEELEYLSHSEDLQEKSADIRKPPNGSNAQTKRSHAAEVHNLSERRRRNRINEKMRALQELIPNCNKVDKASMLEEAIEYLKTLQMQIQAVYATDDVNSCNATHAYANAAQFLTSKPKNEHKHRISPGLSSAPNSTNACTAISMRSKFKTIRPGIPVLMPQPPQFSTLAGPSMSIDSAPEVHAQTAIADTEEHERQNLNVGP
ncbi:transcription factor PIF3-like [Zingiber officinale]|uniref:transcription factor PIF3-like n=1 Tax=Zingiber officinale TaxID=94328 RepID=UPI001C4C4430|nr:transcription factor PIF3-like [Zingiber officinale]